jgi:hypothetical protein
MAETVLSKRDLVERVHIDPELDRIMAYLRSPEGMREMLDAIKSTGGDPDDN